MKLHVLLIDPQNDFCDPNGSLFVPGADEDMKRLAGVVERLAGKIDDIHITLDSHRKVDISHPMWWRDNSGNRPAPFTQITASEVESGVWTTYIPSYRDRTLAYLRALETSGRYPHVVWPEHCLIGREGHNVVPAVADAVALWEDRFAMADIVTKGSNPWTEHFSGVQAEVPDPEDPSTQVNTDLIATLESADIIALAGEALSHCLANTGRDIVAQFSDPKYISKIHLLADATGNVTGFDKLGDDFLREMQEKGMRVTTCRDFLK